MAEDQKYDNLPTIQINIYIRERLAQYYDKVKGAYQDILEILDLGIDFNECCPICKGKGCPEFIGYYYRKVIDEKGILFRDFPIARYLCRRNKKTFSLLPYQLVPYSRYSIPLIIKALEKKYTECLSIRQLQDYLAGFGRDDILSISHGELSWFRRLIIGAVNKIKGSKYYPLFEEETKNKAQDADLLIGFIEFTKVFECLKFEPPIRGPCALGYDFYLNGGGYLRGAHFLFGTPSQFRAKR